MDQSDKGPTEQQEKEDPKQSDQELTGTEEIPTIWVDTATEAGARGWRGKRLVNWQRQPVSTLQKSQDLVESRHSPERPN